MWSSILIIDELCFFFKVNNGPWGSSRLTIEEMGFFNVNDRGTWDHLRLIMEFFKVDNREPWPPMVLQG